ncbi:MAG: sodium:alanine symporter family protein [Treponema sp.]|nr:sodium:alanine symporter family protein [Treponema sp.]
MFEKFDSILGAIDDFVWGLPLIILILATGVFLTVILRGVQFSQLKFAISSIFRKSEKGEGGELSSFKALCTALSATIGTGNIVGVATAIGIGGPGALFWMWLAALLGMATKYAECLLAIHFREEKADGHILGGPFYTCEKGVGAKFPALGKLLAVLFAIFGTMVGLFGIGTFSQVNSITSAVETFARTATPNLSTITIGSIGTYTHVVVIASIVLAVIAALVIIGGLKRISSVAGVIVPVMAVLYFVLGMFAILCNLSKLSGAIEQIFQGAFGFKAAAGGAIGAMIVAMQKGIARGIFSNEAGLGSAPIAASTAKVEHAIQQGIISMTGTFFDTIVICSITGLVIVMSGSWEPAWGLKGFAITNAAFQWLLPVVPKVVISFILMVSLVLFAFTTILGWDFYSERCIEYLSKGNMLPVKIYRWLYIAAVFIGPYMTISAVWTIADIFNGLMALPNIISLLILSGTVVKLTNDFFSGNKLYRIGYDFANNPVTAD